ncbi:hypothetical protein BDM02DRAFT_3191789 [Thelephora ganbajun]|uniref:Uncharacterized protein n=1 Tax=Thelephora ganbajun TaxID=370292 RepID=A0ACB6Z1I4_THEGA|nr:hypothetical protein BDM02DRAFT_3191789 [Thelephora ganbajun]
MTPRRLHNFSNILQERNNAARTLSNYSASCSVQIDDLGKISKRDFSWPRIAVFQATKELWKLRDAPEINRTASQSLITTEEVVATATLQDPLQPQQPDESGTLQSERDEDQLIKPTEQPTASTSNINQTILGSKPTRTVSSNSLSSKLASTTSFEQPLAFNFFNPTTDLLKGEHPVPPANFGVHTERVSTNVGRMIQPLPRSDSLSHRGSFLSPPTPGLSMPSPHFQTRLGTMSIRESSPFAHATGLVLLPVRISHGHYGKDETHMKIWTLNEVDARRLAIKGESTGIYGSSMGVWSV